MLLPHEFRQRPRPHPGGQRLSLPKVVGFGFLEQRCHYFSLCLRQRPGDEPVQRQVPFSCRTPPYPPIIGSMDTLGKFAIVFLGPAVFVVYIASAKGLAWWLLEPINRVAGHLQLSTRFMLTDVMGLMALLQLPLAIAGRGLESTSRSDEHKLYWFFLAMTAILAVVLWAAAVSVVSRAGITQLWRRLCVIVLLVPGTTAVIILWPLA